MPSDDKPLTRQRRNALVEDAGPELLADGQEEVFSYSAVERGLVRDPLAMDPAGLGQSGVNSPPPRAPLVDEASSDQSKI